MINLKQDVWYVVLVDELVYQPVKGVNPTGKKTIKSPSRARTMGAIYRDEGRARRAAGAAGGSGTVAKVELKVVETYKYVPESREVIKNV